MSSKTFTLLAGTYFLGDPCYVVEDHDLWIDFLVASNYLNDGVAVVRELTIWAGGTQYGDGVYTDDEGYSYGVDAGLIGIVSLKDVEQMASADVVEKLLNDTAGSLGRLVTFDNEFRVVFSSDDPTHRFGEIEICTGGGEEDDQYEDEDEEYEDDE